MFLFVLDQFRRLINFFFGSDFDLTLRVIALLFLLLLGKGLLKSLGLRMRWLTC